MNESFRVIWYRVLQVLARVFCTAFFQIRVTGRRHVPLHGGALLVSNHQSYLDPVLVGVGPWRRLSYLARESLFHVPVFAWLIRSLGAIPIDREGLGLKGVKETLRRLRRGEAVVLFPEATRTRDGHLGRVRPGFYSLASHAKVPLVPVRIDGAFQAWPRSAALPRMHPIRIAYGVSLMPGEVRRLGEEAVAEWLRRQWAALAEPRQGTSAELE